ncbi:strawberry notch family protein [Methylobacterium sp. NEAU 140]|uniref:strawberry notch-like NTP hydrolase domain-containing protein n=1 Tax=Methylobacterium sp. NEAU 140 TaxID=3064945 RepID=UPI00273749C7|nr:strawberry notch family protein [Methylobacterium sp. NEAU 140]MDP4025754.1 strawberry notch family protein [Methylobacterium sp. NEAU 140]
MNVSISPKHFQASNALTPTPNPAGILQAGTRLAGLLAQGRAIGTDTLREAVEAACGGSDAEGLWLWKDAYEAGEIAQALFLRRFWPAMSDKAATPAARLAMLGRIAGLMPTHTRRSEESEALQQFSTPLPLGYVAALAAGLRPGERLLEPSAGTGLLAIHAELAGARLHLNELAAARAGLLRALYPAVVVTQLDAAQIHDRLDAGVIPDVVLMNPPFSVAAHVEGRYRDATATHLRSALTRLAPGGRLVAITGEGFRPDRPSTASAFAALAEQGGRLVFSAGLSGRAYAKHGTTVDVRLSVFDRAPTGEAGDSVAPLGISPDPAALLEAVLAGVPPRLAPVPAPASRSAIPGLSRRPTAVRRSVPRPAGTAAAVTAETADPVAYTVIEELPATPTADAALYETYTLETLRIPGAQPHPTPLVQSTAMASVRLPRPSHAPRLPGVVVIDGLLSECQLETVIYTGAAHARHLPGHWTVDETGTVLSAAAAGAEGAVRFRQGFFLGDGTGAGKGRQVAGVILDNWGQGRRRALWISKSDALLEDAQRDWRHLGQEPLQIVPLSRFAPGKPVTLGEGILFTTFATLRGAGRNGTGSRLDQICDWLGADFDGVIALDEAHALANAAAGSGDRGVVEASQQGRAGLALQYRLPDARVLYVSATGAVTVEKLAYAHRLGLWGGGAFPFPTRSDFVSAMQQGGLAAMEVLARDLKALGLYTARSLSYAGVEVEMLDHALSPEQTAIYDAYADAFQVIHTNLDAALKASGVTGASGTLNRAAKSAARSAFESSKQRFFNHLLTAMKCPSLIADIEAGIEAGHAAVVQIVSTGEALMERRLSEISSSEWDDLQVDVTPREYVMDYLASAFPTQLYEPYSDDGCTILSRPVTDAEGRPVQCREAVERRDALIEHLCGLAPVQSALDQILHHFGTGAVAEVTGRSRRIVRQTGKDGVDRLVLQNRPAAANLSETQAFQDDEKRILVFSDAGGTGRSYHADRGAKNRRLRVHYLLEAGWKADVAVQGLGRTNRTNQAQAPLFRPVTTDVKGEKRFLSTIARRLDTLGAITRGQRQTGGQGLFRPEDNLEGPYAATALRQLFWAIVRGEIAGCPLKQFEAMTGLALTNEAGGLLDALPPIGRFLNRVLALHIAVQNLLFEAFEERLALVIEGAIASGVYDVGVEVLTAESFTVTEREVAYTHPGSGAHTHLLTIAERRRLRPLDLDAALDMVAGGYTPVLNAKSGRPALMGTAASETREDGSVVARVRLVRPLQRQILDRDQYARSHFAEASLDAFRAAWEAELASLPEFDERTLYVVTGLLLPIWDRLPGIDMRVFRLVTDAGERVVGRVVEPEDLHVTRERLNLGAGTAMAPAEAFAAVLGGRAGLQLTGGVQVKRVRVMGEDRIEVFGVSDGARAGLKAIGLFAEVIAWRTRLFIPAGERGPAILTALLDRHPLLRCTSANGHA